MWIEIQVLFVLFLKENSFFHRTVSFYIAQIQNREKWRKIQVFFAYFYTSSISTCVWSFISKKSLKSQIVSNKWCCLFSCVFLIHLWMVFMSILILPIPVTNANVKRGLKVECYVSVIENKVVSMCLKIDSIFIDNFPLYHFVI